VLLLWREDPWRVLSALWDLSGPCRSTLSLALSGGWETGMSAREAHPRGKLEFAGAIDDLIAQIEMERQNRPAGVIWMHRHGGAR